MTLPRLLLMCLALLSTLWLGAAQALPTVDEVQAATRRGDHAGAEKMMREVVAAKPDSPRAHYVLAELLAHRRQFEEAAEHTRRARALDPTIKFADATKFVAFEQALQRQQAAAAAPLATPAAPPPVPAPVERVERAGSFGGVPIWLLVAGAILFIGVVARLLRRQPTQTSEPAWAGGAGPTMGSVGGMSQGSSAGSNLMGIGLGVAGGVAAGMLAERLLQGGQDERGLGRDATAGGVGGVIPGSFGGIDPGAAIDLTSRDIDFGSGDGWGGGDAGGSGDW